MVNEMYWDVVHELMKCQDSDSISHEYVSISKKNSIPLIINRFLFLYFVAVFIFIESIELGAAQLAN